jgi:hypothetical protein
MKPELKELQKLWLCSGLLSIVPNVMQVYFSFLTDLNNEYENSIRSITQVFSPL